MSTEIKLQQIVVDLGTMHKILRSPMPAGNQCKDTLLVIHSLAVEVVKQACKNLDNKRECGGLYWRKYAAVSARLANINENRKRRIDTSLFCRSKGKCKFDKNGIGPPRIGDDSGSIMLCNKCFETFRRDQKNEIFIKIK